MTVLELFAERLTQLAHSFTWILEFAELALDQTLCEIAVAQQGDEKAHIGEPNHVLVGRVCDRPRVERLMVTGREPATPTAFSPNAIWPSGPSSDSISASSSLSEVSVCPPNHPHIAPSGASTRSSCRWVTVIRP
jgi:hypothetical protein